MKELPELGVISVKGAPINIMEEIPFVSLINQKVDTLRAKNILIQTDAPDPATNKKASYYHQLTGAPGLCFFSSVGKSARISVNRERLNKGLTNLNDRFENGWFTLLHEVNNVEKVDKFGLLDDEALKGTVSRDDFVTKCVSLEVDSMLAALKSLEDGLSQLQQAYPSVSFGFIKKQYGQLKTMKYYDIISYYCGSQLGAYYARSYDTQRSSYTPGGR